MYSIHSSNGPGKNVFESVCFACSAPITSPRRQECKQFVSRVDAVFNDIGSAKILRPGNNLQVKAEGSD